MPHLDAALAGSVGAAGLGSLLNDSGAIVGGVAMAMVACSLAYLVLCHDQLGHDDLGHDDLEPV